MDGGGGERIGEATFSIYEKQKQNKMWRDGMFEDCLMTTKMLNFENFKMV